MRDDNYFPDVSPEKSFGFKLVLILVAAMTISFSVFRIKRIIENPVQLDPTIGIEPLWYSYTVLAMAIVTLVGLWFTYQYKKWGVYATVSALFIIVILNPEFSLLKTLLPMFTLFTFVGYGLFEIIPRWKYYS
ncbi:hypothetical protein EDL99_10060 [Ornithobacterium rhinotracheale]|uniref:hypothetical protein n=1 Tax=Ornithobacterium rhinotracheale TaxID=28251 RepID=UPI00129D1411|nr:hypothetical protein [Ornithobacterium rhinotracheale]MRJ09200.1 hypothetical protein [Ornithobacterium rhinotracheale]UOH76995.1 hypothetical protein MT996_07125 [Ornithobacterium rhinotracheale]